MHCQYFGKDAQRLLLNKKHIPKILARLLLLLVWHLVPMIHCRYFGKDAQRLLLNKKDIPQKKTSRAISFWTNQKILPVSLLLFSDTT